MEEGKSNRVGQGKRIDHFLSNDSPKLSVFSTRVDRPNSRDARDNREELSASRYQNSKSPWKSQDSTNTTDPIILVLNGWSVDIYAYLFCRKSHWRIRKWSDIKYERDNPVSNENDSFWFQLYQYLLADTKLRLMFNLGPQCGIVTFVTLLMMFIVIVCSLVVSRIFAHFYDNGSFRETIGQKI